MDSRAPSPYPPAQRQGGYPAGYPAQGGVPAGYAQGYPQEYAQEAPVAQGYAGGMGSAHVEEAKRTHARGAMIYFLGWIAISVSFPLLLGSLGLAIGSGAFTDTARDLLLVGVGLLAAGMAVRGAGFSLMMKADFIVRAQAWLGGR